MRCGIVDRLNKHPALQLTVCIDDQIAFRPTGASILTLHPGRAACYHHTGDVITAELRRPDCGAYPAVNAQWRLNNLRADGECGDPVIGQTEVLMQGHRTAREVAGDLDPHGGRG